MPYQFMQVGAPGRAHCAVARCSPSPAQCRKTVWNGKAAPGQDPTACRKGENAPLSPSNQSPVRHGAWRCFLGAAVSGVRARRWLALVTVLPSRAPRNRAQAWRVKWKDPLRPSHALFAVRAPHGGCWLPEAAGPWAQRSERPWWPRNRKLSPWTAAAGVRKGRHSPASPWT